MRPQQLIVTHANADFDGLGAALAARRLYPAAALCLQGGLNRNVREFVALHADELQLCDPSRIDTSAVTRLIVVESPHLSRLGDLAGVATRDGVEAVLFDHHGDGAAPDWVTPGCYVAGEDGALCTTMVAILAERGIDPTPTEATALALGIHEDTGSLTFPTTTVRDIEALGFCARHGASQELVSSLLHPPLADDQRALLQALMEAAGPEHAGGVEVQLAFVAWPDYVDGISTLASKMVDLSDCRALVMGVAMEGRVFVVGRSRVPELDMRAALAAVGGGGHAQAASAIVRGAALEDVRQQVVDGLPGAIAGTHRACDIMSTPAWFVDAGATIEEAMDGCRRRGTSGVQVEEGGRVVGAVAREDLDRAIGHGLGHAPVRAVMSSHVDAVSPAATMAEVQRALGAAAAGRLAVVERAGDAAPAVEQVLGVVTRSDLLAALRETGAEDGAAPGENLAGLLERPGLEQLWRAVQRAATGFDGVHLVGGAVRDLLLGEPSFDIDLAVEGDGIAFADELARALDGRAHPHEKFHTAVVLAGGLRVDVASARTEHYEYPAALPIVEHASIRADLHRRDFTVNAMAIALHASEYGRLLDPYGGRDDLSRGVVRVLHNLSFIEDPTRIFRAVRYENRYGFAMDARTRGLARGCVDMGLVGELSGARVRDELVALLDEADVSAALGRLLELGLDQALHPGFDCTPATAELIGRADRLRAAHDRQLPAWRLRLAACLHAVPADDVVAWLERLRVRRRDARAIAAAAALPARLVAPLERAPTPADVADLLAPHPPEVALLTAARGSVAAADFLEHLARIRLELDGETLRRELGLPESPQIGEILGQLLRRKRNGELPGLADELAAARSLAGAVGG
ncbi:MAG TPA: CBS domain-containing protein [Gaiellales bacterium]|nr:CBS domain-containing protein [Gaiellales bacterium]